MTKWTRSYVPHLTIKEASLWPGGEWRPNLPGWSLTQVSTGSGYWIGAKVTHDLHTGSVFLLSAHASGTIRSSLLGPMVLHFFSADLERLSGLITLGEQHFFEAAESKDEFSARIYPAQSTVALEMKALCGEPDRAGLRHRLRLIQLFIDAFGGEMTPDLAAPAPQLDAKERLQDFLRHTPASDLLSMNLSELARLTRCTPRHLNRLFNEVVGMSFREKHTELRLARACELLATTQAKVVDVALESGYQSLSLFNLMFTRRFGMSPGRWRRIRRGDRIDTPGRSRSRVHCNGIS